MCFLNGFVSHCVAECVEPSEENQCFPPPAESRHAVLARVLACTSSASSLSCFSKSELDHECSNSQKSCVEKAQGCCTSGSQQTDLLPSPGWVHAYVWFQGCGEWKGQPCGSLFIFYTSCKLRLFNFVKVCWLTGAGCGRLGRTQHRERLFSVVLPIASAAQALAVAHLQPKDPLGKACVTGFPFTYSMLTFSWRKFYCCSV